MKAKKNNPTVFISYSHEPPEHKQWVIELATRLIREEGIDVMLDHWDLRLGASVPEYMKTSSKKADYIILIWTEKYVEKVNEPVGGVGYENLIFTEALMRDLSTEIFLPIVRQQCERKKLPSGLSDRLYIDFSDDSLFEQNFKALSRAIHNAPEDRKPALGPNPYAPPSGMSEVDFTLCQMRSQFRTITQYSNVPDHELDENVLFDLVGKGQVKSLSELQRLVDSEDILGILNQIYQDELGRPIDVVGFAYRGGFLLRHAVSKAAIKQMRDEVHNDPAGKEYRQKLSSEHK